jgi:hypothetical protein
MPVAAAPDDQVGAVSTPARRRPDARPGPGTPRPTGATAPGAATAEPTAATVAGEPLPGQESGRVDGGDGGDGAARWVLRGILFVPRIALELIDAPVRAALWANERYELSNVYYRLLFNDRRTIGVVPTGSFDTGASFTIGARFVDRDVFGEHEHVSLSAVTGGGFRATVSAAARTGDRLGDHVELGVEATFDRRPNDVFYGIGNGDLTSPPPAPVDPRVDSTAVETRYRQEIERVALVGDVRPGKRFHLRTTASLTDLDLGVAESRDDMDRRIDRVYDPDGLVGFADTKQAYGEIEVRWDGRDRRSVWDSRQVYSGGGLAAVFAGRVHRFDPGDDFSRYGVELQYFVRLADGPRVLATRFHAEAVTGTRDQVPLTELPQLGGASFLRGYPGGRFRDRVAAFGSGEYQWDLSQLLDASLFVDAGRVFPSLEEVSVDHLRVGFGVALSVHSNSDFLLQASLATSIDGGVFLNLAFNRAFDSTTRWR